MPSTVKDQTRAAQRLLGKANGILQDVDESFIFKTYPVRELPSFEPSELKFGPILGVGGFCLVREVYQIKLKASSAQTEEADDIRQSTAAARKLAHSLLEDDDKFYDIATAREYMAKNYRRDGDARYAVKFLHDGMSKLEDARGKIDLAIEAKYLSVISHPNIIKMRAWAACDPLDDAFFIILDRLYDTLEERMEKWREVKKTAKGPLAGIFGGLGSNKEALQELMQDRLLVAYDLSSAFRYLNENQIVYRDIKPDNIGFDVRGDVKVFDFGLCKSLSPKLRTKDGMYRLTGRTGSFPYMAPEIAQCLPYNCSADVFSYGIMLWEMLALKPIFGGNLTRKQYYDRVSLGGERPPVPSKWPPLTRQIMQDAWNGNPKKRPTFKRVGTLIRADLEDLSHDDTIIHRTKHMQQRSIRSRHGLQGSVSRLIPVTPSQHGGTADPSLSARNGSLSDPTYSS